MLSIESNISIVILTYNASNTIEKLLKSLSEQTYSDYEIVIIDSNSVDKTESIFKKDKINFERIDKQDFNYGTTKNYASFNFCKGDIIIFLSQDAIPTNKSWLINLVTPLIKEKNICATYSRQIINPEIGCNLLEETIFPMRFPNYDIIFDENNLNKLFFSNVCSAVKKKILLAFPFKKILFAEDRIWANEVIRAGYFIKYVSDAVVYHSHNYKLKEIYFISRDNSIVKRITNNFQYSLKSFIKKFLSPKEIISQYRSFKKVKSLSHYSKDKSFIYFFSVILISNLGEIVGSRIKYRKYIWK